MKKLLTFAALCFGMFTVANAQYAPEKGDFAVEFGFTPFQAGGETFKLNEGMLKARYFVSGKDAIRLKLGFDIDNTTTTNTKSYSPTDTKGEKVFDEIIETKEKTRSFSIMLGYERHLFTKGRFDVYAGLELGYMLSKNRGTGTYDYTETIYDSDNNRTSYTEIHDSYDFYNTFGTVISTSTWTPSGTIQGSSASIGGGRSTHTFCGNLFAGVDFYVWKNLYLGAEIALNFKTGKTPKSYMNSSTNYTNTTYNTSGTANVTTIRKGTFNGETGETTSYYSQTGTATTTTPPSYGNVTKREVKDTSFNLNVEPAIRIGWRF